MCALKPGSKLFGRKCFVFVYEQHSPNQIQISDRRLFSLMSDNEIFGDRSANSNEIPAIQAVTKEHTNKTRAAVYGRSFWVVFMIFIDPLMYFCFYFISNCIRFGPPYLRDCWSKRCEKGQIWFVMQQIKETPQRKYLFCQKRA